MTRPIRFAARIALILALVTLVPLLFAPASHAPATSPYLSALSDLGAAPVLAASTCLNTACTSRGLCARGKGFNCRHAAGECQATAC